MIPRDNLLEKLSTFESFIPWANMAATPALIFTRWCWPNSVVRLAKLYRDTRKSTKVEKCHTSISWALCRTRVRLAKLCRDTRKSTKVEKCHTSINCALCRTRNVGTFYYLRLTEILSHVRFATMCCSWVGYLSKIRMSSTVTKY